MVSREAVFSSAMDCSKDCILWDATRASQRENGGENMDASSKLEKELKFYITKMNAFL
jgi:hypothetical protein